MEAPRISIRISILNMISNELLRVYTNSIDGIFEFHVNVDTCRGSTGRRDRCTWKTEENAGFVGQNTCKEDKKEAAPGKEAVGGKRGRDRPAVTNHPCGIFEVSVSLLNTG